MPWDQTHNLRQHDRMSCHYYDGWDCGVLVVSMVEIETSAQYSRTRNTQNR